MWLKHSISGVLLSFTSHRNSNPTKHPFPFAGTNKNHHPYQTLINQSKCLESLFTAQISVFLNVLLNHRMDRKSSKNRVSREGLCDTIGCRSKGGCQCHTAPTPFAQAFPPLPCPLHSSTLAPLKSRAYAVKYGCQVTWFEL